MAAGWKYRTLKRREIACSHIIGLRQSTGDVSGAALQLRYNLLTNISPKPTNGTGDTDGGGRRAGAVENRRGIAAEALLQLLVVAGVSIRPDSGQFPAQRF